MPGCALILNFNGSLTAGLQTSYLFETVELAEATRAKIVGAAKAWDDRANDREKLVTFAHATGNATVDVSNLIATCVDDPLGPQRAMVEEWNRETAAIRALAGGEAA